MALDLGVHPFDVCISLLGYCVHLQFAGPSDVLLFFTTCSAFTTKALIRPRHLPPPLRAPAPLHWLVPGRARAILAGQRPGGTVMGIFIHHAVRTVRNAGESGSTGDRTQFILWTFNICFNFPAFWGWGRL